MKNYLRYAFKLYLLASLCTFASTADAHTAINNKKIDTKNVVGYCGDGIINGDEQCDGRAISVSSCKTLGGREGIVKCQPNCILDISECTGSTLAGTAEACNCNCTRNLCKGGCTSTGLEGESHCEFICDNGCDCLCGKNQQAKIERLDYRCDCAVDRQGMPQCRCSTDSGDLTVAINRNPVANLISNLSKMRSNGLKSN